MKQHNKVLTKEDAETLTGLLRSAGQELTKDERYLDLFEVEVDQAQVNAPWRGVGRNGRPGTICQVNLPESADASQDRAAAEKERNMAPKVPSMLISQTNLSSIKQLLASARRVLTRQHTHLGVFAEHLKAAEVVAHDKVPSDVITMNSQVRIHDLSVGRYAVYTLVFPSDADVARNRISVLAPVGSALLGCRVGALIECEVPGVAIRMRVKELVYQPESDGRAA